MPTPPGLTLAGRRRTRTYDAQDTQAIGEYLFDTANPIGSVVTKFTDAVPSDAWLLLNGQMVSKETYPLLYAELQPLITAGDLTETADEFQVPNLTDAAMVGAGAIAAGKSGGANSYSLTEAQLPAHSHAVTDPGHTHPFTGAPHTHTITDPGHSHTAAAANGTADAGTGGDVTSAIAGTTGTETTGISVDSATVNGTVDAATTGISIGGTGAGAAIDNRPLSVGVFHFIKARW